MRLAIYLAAVSVVYALLAVTAPAIADALLVGFVALLVVPTAIHDIGRLRRSRR